MAWYNEIYKKYYGQNSQFSHENELLERSTKPLTLKMGQSDQNMFLS